MSILEYFKRTSTSVIQPNVTLSAIVPSKAIVAANAEVQPLAAKRLSRKHGPYNNYAPKELAAIGKYAVQHGATATAKVFSRKLGKTFHESTVRGFKMLYKEDISKKREAGDDDACVTKLDTKRKGRPVVTRWILWSRIMCEP